MEECAVSPLASTLQRKLKPLVSRNRGNLVAMNIVERGKKLSALCPDDEVFTLSWELILHRVYEQGGVSFYDGMDTVVDAGAHVGIFSLQASQWASRVVSIEASRVNYDILKLNIDRNEILNIEPRHCALWNMSGEALHFEALHHTGGGRVTDQSQLGEHGDTVESLSLDDLIVQIGKIDLLKIDIEGAEYEVLGACKSLSSISCIVGEMHLEHPNERHLLDSLVAQLEDAGFIVRLVTEKELHSRDGLARLLRNRSSLQGKTMTKALAAAYFAAPIEKPVRPSGATYELPVLVAHQPA